MSPPISSADRSRRDEALAALLEGDPEEFARLSIDCACALGRLSEIREVRRELARELLEITWRGARAPGPCGLTLVQAKALGPEGCLCGFGPRSHHDPEALERAALERRFDAPETTDPLERRFDKPAPDADAGWDALMDLVSAPRALDPLDPLDAALDHDAPTGGAS